MAKLLIVPGDMAVLAEHACVWSNVAANDTDEVAFGDRLLDRRVLVVAKFHSRRGWEVPRLFYAVLGTFGFGFVTADDVNIEKAIRP